MLSETPLTAGAFVAVDIETTGSMPGRNGIIELGAARIENGRIVGVFSELVHPPEPIPYSVQLLTGISDRMVAEAPPIGEVFERFRAFAEGAVLVAHNYRFDLGFLDYHAEVATGLPFPRPVLDTLAIAKHLEPELGKYNLGLLAETYGVETRPSHRADADARATAEVFLAMIPTLAEAGVHTAGELARCCRMGGQQSLAHKLVITTGLPDEPGLYLLRDARGRVIYVGRAKNLRVRLRSYFYVNSDATGPRLGDETVSVQCIPCCSPLDALLLQSRLIDRYHPRHNVPTQRGDFASLIHVDTRSRFPAMKVIDRRRKDGVSIGPFVNRWAVEAVVDQLREVYGLRRCAARLTGKAGAAECAHRGNDCPSPCVGGIDQEEYRVRVAEAMEVFDRSAGRLRREIVSRHESAIAQGCRDDGVRYRDGLKAFDRALVGLATVREAVRTFGSIIVEADEACVTLHLVRYGYLVRTLRLTKAECESRSCEERIRRALHRAYFAGPYDNDPMGFTPQQLKDVFLIHGHRQQVSPREIEVTAEEESTSASVLSALRRHMRVTRRRHVLSSTG
ncbi:MAG TPA: exonuclease domain-containing protein [Coriobacteriia bacterium]|jgi:DNA polymerase-3 subunit epsilon